MEKKINKKEIAELLGKSYPTIKRWKEEKLQEELKKNCWVVVNKEKIGREVIYTLEYQEQDFNINVYMEGEFNVKNGENFMNYSKERLENAENNIPATRKEICEKTGTATATAKRYDKKLIQKEVIKEDDYYYIKKEGDKKTIVTEEEYKSFWRKNRAIEIVFEQLEERVKQKEITLKEYNYLYEELRERYHLFYFKVRRYLVNENSVIFKLIKNN